MVAYAFAIDDAEPERAPLRPHLRLVPTIGGLTPGERQAVEIGRDDAFRFGWDVGLPGSGLLQGMIGAVARLTGIKSVVPLADGRLEKLRLFAAMMRRGDQRVHAMGDDLLADGLTPAALREVIVLALA
jgi:hypothetical protein